MTSTIASPISFRPLSHRVLAACLMAAIMALSACGQTSGGPEARVEVRIIDAGPAVAATGSDDPDSTDGQPVESNQGEETAGSSTDDVSDATTGTNAGGNGGSSAPDGFVVATQPLDAITDRNSLAPDEADLRIDEELSGDIETNFGADRWTFDATAGQLLTVDVRSIGPDGNCRQDLRLYLNDPAETVYELGWIGNFGCQQYGPWILPLDGPYSLEFGGGDGGIISPATGPYSFVASFLDDFDENSLSLDAKTDGSIDEAFGVDRWTFEAEAGQKLVVALTSIGDNCRQDLRMFLAYPSGERSELGWVGNFGCKAYEPVELTEAGSYALEFVGGDGGIISPATGPYSFTATLG